MQNSTAQHNTKQTKHTKQHNAKQHSTTQHKTNETQQTRKKIKLHGDKYRTQRNSATRLQTEEYKHNKTAQDKTKTNTAERTQHEVYKEKKHNKTTQHKKNTIHHRIVPYSAVLYSVLNALRESVNLSGYCLLKFLGNETCLNILETFFLFLRNEFVPKTNIFFCAAIYDVFLQLP